jgi:hypothetical protein
MTQTTTIPAVHINTNNAYSSDVFYGSFRTYVKGKSLDVSVSNHLKDTDKEYEFRIAGKCKAGFINIHDTKGTVDVIRGYGKNSLVNIQAKNEYGQWMNVYTTKGGKWYSIDLGFLKVITVGTMRESFPDMCDMNLWNLVGAKTWADKAFAK